MLHVTVERVFEMTGLLMERNGKVLPYSVNPFSGYY